MARIRTIKPEFWKNEILGELNPDAQLLFIGLWNLSDRRGFLEDRPKRIKADLFPYREVDVENNLTTLEFNGFIKRIEIGEKFYIQIVNFTKHQVCNVKEPESTVPAQYWHNTGTVPASQEGKGRERNGKEGKGCEWEGSNVFDFENTKKILLSEEELSWRETLQMLTVFKNENICNKKIKGGIF